MHIAKQVISKRETKCKKTCIIDHERVQHCVNAGSCESERERDVWLLRMRKWEYNKTGICVYWMASSHCTVDIGTCHDVDKFVWLHWSCTETDCLDDIMHVILEDWGHPQWLSSSSRPLVPEILDQTDCVGAKFPIFNLFSLVATQP